MNADSERLLKEAVLACLRQYLSISLEELRKTMKNLEVWTFVFMAEI
jgi:hypothetical protein